ncbi:type VI secretion system accessory protein TagJ [Parazoarcus communis]|nr:type VI secretion system accessory protein TagJ [Parazoarcus communis]
MPSTDQDNAEAQLRAGHPEAALSLLQAEIRRQPANSKLRIFLFQLLAILGQWDRAMNQLNVAAELDVSALAMAQMYREALRCEVLRSEVFAGKRAPLVFGEPEQWLALLVESLLVAGRGQQTEAAALRDRAFELAPATPGRIDGAPFEWLADADGRLGPVCEAIINGSYYWIPFSRLSRIDIEAPTDLRDYVWAPAHFQFSNGGEAVGVIPTRYPGSEQEADGAIKLAWRTEWLVHAGDYRGLGQRLFATDQGDFALLDIRRVDLGNAERGNIDD